MGRTRVIGIVAETDEDGVNWAFDNLDVIAEWSTSGYVIDGIGRMYVVIAHPQKVAGYEYDSFVTTLKSVENPHKDAIIKAIQDRIR